MKNLPNEVEQLLLTKGIQTDQALAFFKSDMSRDETYCDAYTVLTRDGIGTLFCLDGYQKKAGASFFSRQKTEKVLRQLDYVFFPMSEISSFRVEEQISTLRFVLIKKSGEEEVLLWATCACRKALYDFAEGFDRFSETGEFPKPTKPERERCPKCRMPYDDPKNKVCKHCKSKGRLIRKILPFFLRYRWQMLLVLVTVALSALISIMMPYFNSKVLYDQVLVEGDPLYGQVLFLVLTLAAMRLVSAVIQSVNTLISSRVAAFVTYDLKKTIFSAFERLSYSFFTSRHTGRLITQVNSDSENLYWFFCDGVPYFFVNVIQIVGISSVMIATNPTLAALVLIPVPVLFFAYFAVMKIFRRLNAEQHTHSSRFNSVLSDVLNGMRIVKAFSREETEIERFDDKSRALSASKLKIDVTHHTLFPLINLGIRISTYLVWGFGGYLVVKEGAQAGSGISYGQLSLFVGYLGMLYSPLNFFSNFFNHLASSLNSMQRLFQILDAEPEVKEKKDAIKPETVRGAVTFDHVNFSYAPGKRTIRDVSFSVAAGQTLGIVGHTGAGKSTLANLLTRLYDVESGSITIDGIDLRDLSFETLRKNVAIVSQETYLFRGTIMDNIRYANPEADRETVMAASRAAGCHDFIMTFPDGYETLVGTDKKMLSGGERQRISIARAILKDPAILILDEATAAMDTKTERKIQAALSAITKNRTTITIAHRLSTLRDADFLIVVENGAVVENGTHEQLLAMENGVYHKLYRLQMEAMKTIGIEE